MSIEKDIDIAVLPFQKLIQEVGVWSHNNFGTLQNPWLGMVEEVGELAHCLLKRIQKIRGFDDPAIFIVEFADALGDIGIYAANYAYNEKMYNVRYPQILRADRTQNKHVADSLFWLGNLMLTGETAEDYETWLRNFLKEVSCLALLEGIEFQKVVTETWLKVKLRNWKANSHDGITDTTHGENDSMVETENKTDA